MTGSWPLFAGLTAALVACRGSPPALDRTAPAEPAVTLEGPSGRSTRVRVEVAKSPRELERGLMFREKLGADEGMLFVFPEPAVQAFWMKNTLIPLDMIFIDDEGTVVGIVESAEPMTTDVRSVGLPSRFVLEVNGGFAAAHGLARGDRARLEGLPAR